MSEAVAIQSAVRPAGTVSQTGGAAPGRRLPKAAGEGHRGKGPQVVDVAAVTGGSEGNAERGTRNAEQGKAGGNAERGTRNAEGTAEEPLTTERLQASLLEQFRGKGTAGGAANAADGAEGDGETTGLEAGDDSEPSLAPAEGTEGDTSPQPSPQSGEGEEVEQSQKGLIDAVTALRAERRELRAELEGLKGKLEAIAAGNAGGTPADATATVALPGTEKAGAGQTDAALFDAEVQEVLAQEQGQRELVGWTRHQLRALDKNPDGVVAELKRRKIELSSEDPEVVKDWLEGVHENGRAKLDELIVERRAVLNVARQRNSEVSSATGKIAEQILPEKKDAGSDRAKLYEHVMKNNPSLRNTPDGEMRAALQVLGIEQAMSVIAAGGGDAVAVMKLGHLKLKAKTPGGTPGGATGTVALPGNGTGKKTVVHRAPTTRLPGAPVNVAGSDGTSGAPTSDQLYQRYVKEPTEGNKMAWMRSTLRRK